MFEAEGTVLLPFAGAQATVVRSIITMESSLQSGPPPGSAVPEGQQQVVFAAEDRATQDSLPLSVEVLR